MSEFILQIEKLFAAFGDPEYRYLLLEPLVFYGLLAGVILLAIGLGIKNGKLQTAALVTLGVAAFVQLPYKEARLAAQPRLEQVYRVSAPTRVSGFAANTKEWIEVSWMFKLLIVGAGTALVIGVNRHRVGYGLAVASGVLGLWAAKDAMWLNYQDALAYHPHLKSHEAPYEKGRPTLRATPVGSAPTPTNRTSSRLPVATVVEQPRPAAAASSSLTDRILPPPVPPSRDPQPRTIKPLTSF
jgi:hypothetical protein